MKLLYRNRLILDVPYLVNNNGSLYYQRGIPKDLQERFNKKILRIKLDASDKRLTPAQQAEKYTNNHTQLFKALRENKDLVISEQKLAALTLLQSFNLKQGNGDAISNIQNSDEYDVETVGNIADFLRYYDSQEESGQLTQTDRLAKTALNTPLPLLLSEVIDLYFDNHSKGENKDFAKRTRSRWNKFIEIVGDVPLISINRETAKKYRDGRLNQTYGTKNPEPVKTTTVEREIKAIRAIINKVTKEEDLNLRNPFESLTIPKLGGDATQRQPFDADELALLINEAQKNFDQAKRILVIQAFTGARVSEIAGLLKEDFIHGEIPHISIRPNAGRSLKTKQSERLVPLIDLALTAIQAQVDSLPNKSTPMFPQYYGNDGVKSDAISATANKFLRSLGINKTTHSLRHTMRDMLREAGITSDIAHEIGGWSDQVIGDEYGKGFSLTIKRDALLKATRAISSNWGSLTLNPSEKHPQSPNNASEMSPKEGGKRGMKMMNRRTKTIHQIDIEVVSEDLGEYAENPFKRSTRTSSEITDK